MNYLWGFLMFMIGLFFLVSAIRKSEFIVYKILTARSRVLWKEKVHSFYIFVGIIIMCLSLLFFFNVWG